MNEISVVVNQEPGKISWNFADIKKRLEEELTVYQNTAYTDDTIKTAKGDVADLRKLAKAIEDRRKEVKEKCMEPYALIETQAKELTDLIEKPIQAINDQVKDYERRRKEKARAEINAFWVQKAAELPEDIREKAKKAIYDERWENATATKKSWREGIENGIRKILDEIGTIKSFASEFEEDMLTVYKDALSLQKAIQKMNELNAQKERILEQERKRREAEEAERKRQEEERQRREELAKQKAQEEQQRNDGHKGDGQNDFYDIRHVFSSFKNMSAYFLCLSAGRVLSHPGTKKRDLYLPVKVSLRSQLETSARPGRGERRPDGARPGVPGNYSLLTLLSYHICRKSAMDILTKP